MKLGRGCGDWEAGPATHRIVRNTAQAPSPTLTPPAQRAPALPGGAGGEGMTQGFTAEHLQGNPAKTRAGG